MKIISIRQPWATLIMLGEKRFETRSWQTKHRGPIGIHASKVIDREAIDRLSKVYCDLFHEINLDYDEWPTGVILATANLSGCYRVYDTIDNGKHIVRCPNDKYEFEKVEYLWKPETDFGWFAEGRYAWELEDVQRMSEPIPAKGQLSLWEFPLEQIGV